MLRLPRSLVKGRMGRGVTLDLAATFLPTGPGRGRVSVTGHSRPHDALGTIALDVDANAAPPVVKARGVLPCAPEFHHALYARVSSGQEGTVRVVLSSDIDPAFFLDVTIPADFFLLIGRGG